ncbi:MAG: RNA 3'-terminal phosphate cyclase [Pseudomonadota bacterium]
MLTLDGSTGEGGGQILRSALSLSMCLSRPFRIINIRATRRKPGLRRQHLAAVLAAAEVSNATLEGATLGSGELRFVPRRVAAGRYVFDIGTAGSTTLVAQTLLPALLGARGPSRLEIGGGTHNPRAPSFDFLKQAFVPLINRMGAKVSVHLERPGYFPAGGGRMCLDISPPPALNPLELHERGEILNLKATAVVANLPLHIAQRELKTIATELDLKQEALELHQEDRARGPGNVLTVTAQCRHITEVFVGFGERRVRAETVASNVAKAVRRYLAADVPVGENLADQLLLPLALAGAASFLTLRPSRHTMTNVEVIQRFMDRRILTREVDTDVWRIWIEGC